jgi:hypothetical protein
MSVGRLLRSGGGGWVIKCSLSRMDADLLLACLRSRCPVRVLLLWVAVDESRAVLTALMSPC